MMKIWIGKDDAMRYWMSHPEREKEMALWAFWRRRYFCHRPRLEIVEDRAPNYGLRGKPCGLFFSWLGLTVWLTHVGMIARMDRWEPFKTPHCNY